MHRTIADDESKVAPIYQDAAVAESYLEKRLLYSWQRLLHFRQSELIQGALRCYRPDKILELAPGPARIAVELKGVREGTMVEYSHEMIEVAGLRLSERGLLSSWTVLHGNAFDLSGLGGQYDFVYTFRFIRHFHAEDRLRLYEQISKKLKTGGCLMFDVVNRSIRERLDRISETSPPDALPVYDAMFAEEEFRSEMSKSGYQVESLTPVVRWFRLQSWLSGKFDDIVPSIVAPVVKGLERLPSPHPLEWVALCRKVRG